MCDEGLIAYRLSRILLQVIDNSLADDTIAQMLLDIIHSGATIVQEEEEVKEEVMQRTEETRASSEVRQSIGRKVALRCLNRGTSLGHMCALAANRN